MINAGYSGSGELYGKPASFWNEFRIWQELISKIAWWKQVADRGPAYFGGPSDQMTAIKNVYGVSMRFPQTPDCAPTSFSGLILWLDAADKSTIITNGSSVTRWKNKSKNGGDAIANAGVVWNATGSGNGKPALLFKNNEWLNGDITLNGNSVTTFCVFNMSGASRAFARTLSFGKKNMGPFHVNSDYNNNEHFGVLRAGGTNLMQDRNNVWTVKPITFDKAQLSTTWINGASSNISVNGDSPTSTGSNGPFNINCYTIGNNIATDDPNGPFYGSISEIIVFNVALSISEIKSVEGYLAWKWGIEVTLPNAHPYKFAAPGKPRPPITPVSATGQINIGDVGMPPGHIFPEPYGLIVSTSLGGSTFNTVRDGIKNGTNYEITVTSNTGAKVTTPLLAINTDGGFYTTMNTPTNMRNAFPMPPTRSLAISISPIY
jgi:hypothetical protein